MVKKIPSQSLRVGMFLEKIDASWFSTPFLRNQFKIVSEQQIKKITDYGIREVFINTTKGIDVELPEPEPMRAAQGKAEVEYLALSLEGLVPGFESQEKVEQYNQYLNNYIPVDPSVFSSGLKTPLGIYWGNDTSVALVLEAGNHVPENEIFCAGKNGHRKNLLIKTEDAEIYKKFLKELAAGKAAGNSSQAAKIRSAVIKESSKLVMKELMDNPRSGEAMKEAKGVVSEMIDSVLENPSSFYGLMKINTHDYYTYVHSINVSTLSVGLGAALGMKKTDLSCLAMGALMHDLGKSQVPKELINKPGKLTDEEFERMKGHVNLGLEILKDQDGLSPRALFPITQHHEKLNGTGYPNKLNGENIHIFGRIASILDVYDAITTERSYKKAFTPFDAAAWLAKNKEEFDQGIVKDFISMLGKQGQ